MTTTKSKVIAANLPAETLDGRTVRSTDLVLREWVEPLATKCGREDCGSGPMHVTGGIAITQSSYYQSIYYATAGEGAKWWNYGAPHGTHEAVVIAWAKVPGVGVGCAGWMVSDAFVTRERALEYAREWVAARRAE